MKPLIFTLLVVFRPSVDLAESPTSLWFDSGHRIVARIAERRLTPHTIEAVRDILGGQSLAEASLWADQIRGSRRETGPLHYVNIPLDATEYDSARDCPAGRCIIAAIEQDLQVLKRPSATLVERAEALRFLIHLIGDLHQPLHVSNANDRGGNLTQVQFNGRGTNLHAVWDGELYQSAWPDEEAYLARLLTELENLDAEEIERGTVVQWAMEGHAVARQAYEIPRNRRLERSYVDRNLPAVDLALIRAGVRLARVLNEALESYPIAGPASPSAAPAASAASAASAVPTYSDAQALAHAGETATVTGTVVTVRRVKSGNIYINFGADYPHQTFSGAILNPRDPALMSLDGLVGKRVGIKGMIKLYKGQAEILITSREQIVLME